VDIIHRKETHNTWYLTRAKTTVKWKSFTYDVTVADMNGLNRYLYVYNAPSIGMDEQEDHWAYFWVQPRRMKLIICFKHRYLDQMGNTPCPECESE
jgi:hypothetical protein